MGVAARSPQPPQKFGHRPSFIGQLLSRNQVLHKNHGEPPPPPKLQEWFIITPNLLTCNYKHSRLYLTRLSTGVLQDVQRPRGFEKAPIVTCA